ncbi:MAG: class I SAM-dependent methyltransferase [Acidobacteriaceae bacterium]|jgi:ubiquinone/menaquinone biosynthesis C-methylase UbiE|nr:class I SAM-dependent methyltransferase [Acidobacteriaceae bacterium]
MPAVNFNRIARAYRWLEYAIFGHALERCRFHLLPLLAGRQHALVLGDGDGRFLHQLLLQNPALKADAVDSSAAMLHLLAARCGRRSVALHCADALAFTPPCAVYDCIVSHFFLDCLSTEECAALVPRLAHYLPAGGLWIVSEFRVPRGMLRIPAALLIRMMYAGFRLLTGLRTQHLPAYEQALRSADFELAEEQTHLRGLLVSQVWRKRC